MNNKLITILRQAAKALEDGTFDYDWSKMQACNCGVVAACVLGKSRNGLLEMIDYLPDGYTWEKFVARACPITGVPTDKVLAALTGIGLTAKDICDLEWLSNQEIINYAGAHGAKFKGEMQTQKYGLFNLRRRDVESNEVDFQSKANLICYLRGWADMLVERGRDDVAVADRQEVPVSGGISP